MVYGSKAILPTDLDYGAPRVRAYDEQGAEASLEDAMDQLDKARDVALLRSAAAMNEQRWRVRLRSGAGKSVYLVDIFYAWPLLTLKN